MTAYVSCVTLQNNTIGNPFIWVYVSPVSYEIRVAQVVATYTLNFGDDPSGNPLTETVQGGVNFYSSALTGGTTVTVLPLREGATSTTATSKSNQGSALPSSGVTIEEFSNAFTYVGGSTWTFQPPFDLIVSPGSSILAWFDAQVQTAIVEFSIFFEELRLSWPY
jgi:hypothetical protein